MKQRASVRARIGAFAGSALRNAAFVSTHEIGIVHRDLKPTRSRVILPVRIDTIDLHNRRRELFKEITPADPAAFGGIQSVVVTPSGNS